jgi:hypothetical protein
MRRAARRAFNLSLAFFCFSAETIDWHASQRLRMRDRVMNGAPHRRHCFVIVSSSGRMPGFFGNK